MKYRVYGIVTGTKFIGEFEADSPEDAEMLAANSEENSVCLCHHCAQDFDLDDIACQSFSVEEVEE